MTFLLVSGWFAGLATGDDRALQPRGGDPLPGLTPEQLERFTTGRLEYDRTVSIDEGLGPIFNAKRCSTCHGADGGNGVDAVTLFGSFDPVTGFDPLSGLGGPVKQEQRNNA